MGIATALEQGIDLYVGDYVTQVSARLASDLVPIVVAGVTIYIVVYGFAVIRGAVNDPVMSFVWKALKISLICSIALSVGNYQDMIYQTGLALQNGLIQAVSRSSSIGQALDDVEKPFVALWAGLFQKASDYVNPMRALPFLIGGAIAVAAHLFVMVSSLGIFLVAKISFGLVMAVGPLFILALIFPPTAPLCESWLKQALQLIMTNLLIAATLAMSTTFVAQYATMVVSSSATEVIGATISLAIVAFVMTVIVKNHPLLAQALVGGLSMGGFGLTQQRMPPPKAGNSINQGAGLNQISGQSGGGAPTAPASMGAKAVGAARSGAALYNRALLRSLRS